MPDMSTKPVSLRHAVRKPLESVVRYLGGWIYDICTLVLFSFALISNFQVPGHSGGCLRKI